MTRLINTLAAQFTGQFGKSHALPRSEQPIAPCNAPHKATHRAPMPHDIALAAIGVTAPEFL